MLQDPYSDSAWYCTLADKIPPDYNCTLCITAVGELTIFFFWQIADNFSDLSEQLNIEFYLLYTEHI